MTENLKARTEQVLTRHAKYKRFTPQCNIIEDLGFDSLALMDLSCSLEEEFGIFIPINLVTEIRTVEDLIRTTERLVRLKKEAPSTQTKPVQ